MPETGRNANKQMQINSKQDAAVVFRCGNAWWKVWPTFLDGVKQQATYGTCI